MTTVKPIPDGFRTLAPYLRCRNAADAIEFYKKAFGAEELCRMPTPDGRRVMHAEIRIGDSILMMGDEFPEWQMLSPLSLGGTGSGVHVYVPDVDAAFARAVGAGATAAMPPQDMFWGDRYAKLTDPFGQEWSIATHVEDVPPEQMADRAAKAFGCGGN